MLAIPHRSNLIGPITGAPVGPNHPELDEAGLTWVATRGPRAADCKLSRARVLVRAAGRQFLARWLGDLVGAVRDFISIEGCVVWRWEFVVGLSWREERSWPGCWM
jgi:hypothetical protein